MTNKELSKLKRRWSADGKRLNCSVIYGCYVSQQKEIITSFAQQMGLLGEEDRSHYLSCFHQAMNGKIGRNVLSIRYQDNNETPEQELLYDLYKGKLSDEEKRTALYREIIENYPAESNFLILLACDIVDVVCKNDTGEKDVVSYPYILCTICPVQPSDSELYYIMPDGEFHAASAGISASKPNFGFLYPACEDNEFGTANIGYALFFTRSEKLDYQRLVKGIFASRTPATEMEHRIVMATAISEAMEEKCDLNFIQRMYHSVKAVQESIDEADKNNVEIEHTMGTDDITSILSHIGASQEQAEKFQSLVAESFGEDSKYTPKGVLDIEHMHISAKDVHISVGKDYEGRITSKVIDGTAYILVEAIDDILVNGVKIVPPK